MYSYEDSIGLTLIIEISCQSHDTYSPYPHLRKGWGVITGRDLTHEH